jgi:hypothetical protein
MAPAYRTKDGYSVEVVQLSDTSGNQDGEWLRVRYHGYHVADVRSVAELERYFPLGELEADGLAHRRAPGRRIVLQLKIDVFMKPLAAEAIMNPLCPVVKSLILTSKACCPPPMLASNMCTRIASPGSSAASACWPSPLWISGKSELLAAVPNGTGQGR